jgi:hypothetical protein
MSVEYTYRVIPLKKYEWAVRRFSDGLCEEVQLLLVIEDDPQLRETDKKIIEVAKRRTDWEKV